MIDQGQVERDTSEEIDPNIALLVGQRELAVDHSCPVEARG